MDEIIKQRISFLMQTRGVLCTYLMVLVGGVTGLLISIFNEYQNILPTVVKSLMAFFGIFCAVIIFNLLNNVTNEIRTHVYKRKEVGNDLG